MDKPKGLNISERAQGERPCLTTKRAREMDERSSDTSERAMGERPCLKREPLNASFSI